MSLVCATYLTQSRLVTFNVIKRCLCDRKIMTIPSSCNLRTFSSAEYFNLFNDKIQDCSFRTYLLRKRSVSSLSSSATLPMLRIMKNGACYFSTNFPSESDKNKTSDISDKNTTNSRNSIDDFRAREEQKEQEYLSSTESSSPNDEGSNEGKESDEKLRILRSKILDASLSYVGTHGWTRKSITKGAESLGYPGVAHGMFPDGGIELIRHFYNKCNNELVEQMIRDTKTGEIITDKPLEFLVNAVKIRLQMIEPYLNQWPQALAIMSLPKNVPTSLAQLLTLVDDICYYSGDRSVDFGWYTRRIGLATIYKMTELYILQDSSVNHEQTWNFLQKRMEDASNFEALISQSDGLTHNMQQKLNSAFETARNILGLDYNRR